MQCSSKLTVSLSEDSPNRGYGTEDAAAAAAVDELDAISAKRKIAFFAFFELPYFPRNRVA